MDTNLLPVAIDFETRPIENYSGTPPEPLGFAVYHPTVCPDGHYYSFGHIENNNCTFEEAKSMLLDFWEWSGGLVFHNAAFDVAVAEHHFNAPRLAPEMYHDTMILAFLYDPNSPGIDLKGLSDSLLDMPKDEQDELKAYLFDHKEEFNPKLSNKKGSDNYFMRYLYHAPGEIAGKYAIGDVIRTYKLYIFFSAYVKHHDMQKAYFLEIETMLLLRDMRYTGIRIDLELLSSELVKYKEIYANVTAWLNEYLGASVNLNASPQIVKALLEKGLVREQDLLLTKTGKLSASADSLANALPVNSPFSSMFGYYKKLSNFLSTFMIPWETMALKSGGLVYSTWHQVKNSETSKVSGTRTGRLSSSPNLQNIPKTVSKPFFKCEANKELPEYPLTGTPDLPKIRRYVVPYAKDHVLISIDYSQQELRILAHFEDGPLLKAYKADPTVDVHTYAMDLVNKKSSLKVKRGDVKAINFGIIYGMGIPKLASTLGVSIDAANAIRQAYFKAMPGVDKLIRQIKNHADSGLPIRTLGGRIYYCEKPNKDGSSRAYKLLNAEIQSSSADMSKQAIVDYNKTKQADVVILLQVHDEFLLSCPLPIAKQEYDKLRASMESYPCDCPLIAEGLHDKVTWADCK